MKSKLLADKIISGVHPKPLQPRSSVFVIGQAFKVYGEFIDQRSTFNKEIMLRINIGTVDLSIHFKYMVGGAPTSGSKGIFKLGKMFPDLCTTINKT